METGALRLAPLFSCQSRSVILSRYHSGVAQTGRVAGEQVTTQNSEDMNHLHPQGYVNYNHRWKTSCSLLPAKVRAGYLDRLYSHGTRYFSLVEQLLQQVGPNSRLALHSLSGLWKGELVCVPSISVESTICTFDNPRANFSRQVLLLHQALQRNITRLTVTHFVSQEKSDLQPSCAVSIGAE